MSSSGITMKEACEIFRNIDQSAALKKALKTINSLWRVFYYLVKTEREV